MPVSFSPKQLKVLTWWRDAAWDAIFCDGTVRSGKTFSMGLSFFLWAQACFDGRQFGLCGKTITALRRNLLAELIPFLRRLGMAVQERRSENLFIVRFSGHENRFLLFGGRDESSASLIQGTTLAGVLLDEAALMPRSFVEQAIARCSVNGSKLWFNCNPEGPQHWLYQEWVLKAQERRALHVHFTMEDNPSLSPDIRERYRRNYSGTFYQRFVLGEWCAAQGLVYDFFDPVRDAAEVPQGPFSEWRISVDYGTVNPASFGLWGLCGGVWFRVDEFYYDSKKAGQQKTDAEYVDDLISLAGEREIQQVIVDPSAASFIQALRRKGFAVVRADNDVSDGLRVTADLLRSGQIVICKNCVDCLREIAQYRWEQRGDRDAPRKENDHAMDELRYFAMSAAKDGEAGFAVAVVERGCF
ncbi:MAG: PBSX family phage terminase large subunit [Oscillibacter sp.]|nr:PBSX family phage terminase large subunit [Oscillibacter sp.]